VRGQPRDDLPGHEGEDQRQGTGQPPGVRTGGRAVRVPLSSRHHLTISSPIRDSKHGWALEFGRRGITANVVSPGTTDTELLREANPGATFEDEVAKTALRRLGQPEDIVAVVAFLAGPDSGWISGQNLAADGGLLP